MGTRTFIYTVKKWVDHFERGDFSTCFGPWLGRQKRVTTPEITQQIREIILEERQI